MSCFDFYRAATGGGNKTHVYEFILLGITEMPALNNILFVVIITCYLINVIGNVSILALVLKDHQLHTPMYFFLGNLSFLDVGISSIMVPKMAANLLLENKTISFAGCIAQLHFFHFLGSTESMILTSMSYDRYVAICHPLRYILIMNVRVCILLACCSWTSGYLYSLLHTILTSRLPFCGPNKVSHFFCDIKPLLKLACTNTYINERLVTIITGFVAVGTFILILVSYVFIGSHLLNIKSTQGRKKAFSTCASHLIIVFFFLGTAIGTYLRPSSEDSIDRDRMASILFTVVTPTLNPFVYTLRNKEVIRALRKIFSKNAV